MNRGITEKILDILQAGAESTATMLDVMLSDRYTSYKKAKYAIGHGGIRFEAKWSEIYKARQVFYATLSKLKKDGLVKERQTRGKRLWILTRKGLSKWNMNKSKNHNLFSPQRTNFEPGEKKRLTIFIFDIPEKERLKRRWLRRCLQSLDFKLLQKSVWVGKCQIPEKFMHALREREMMDYIHIFAVSKSGTIREIE